jgi:putative ABC transport system permease protein
VLGEAILVNGSPSTVVGVVPAAVQFPRRDTEVWTNLPLNPPTRYGPWFYRGLARLKPGVTMEQAQAETNRIARLMMQENPRYQRLALPVLGLRDALLGTTLKPALGVLAGAVGLVLLIALVNVANLMLVRATVREREMALRLGLGAGRARLLRQLLTESVLLAILGGAAGLALAWGGIQLIRETNPGNLPLIDAVRLDAGALGFMLLVSTLAGILFGLAPALTSTRGDLNSSIKEGGRSGAGHAGNRIRSALVISQIAVSLMLLIGAGLLLRSFANLQQVSGGISTPPRRILSMLISPANRRDPAAGLTYYQEVLRRARAIPGVEMAAITDTLPPDRQADADTFELEGHPLSPGQLNPIVTHADVDPDYFRTLGIPLLKGRHFTAHDRPDSTPVAIVSEAFGRRFLAGEEPLGKRLRYNDTWFEIVGVVGNAKYLGLTADTDPAYYIPFAQDYVPLAFLAVRSSADAARLAEPLRQAVQAVDPGATLAQIRTMEEEMALSVSQPRFDSILLGLFAAIALLLAAVGIYGLIAYSVAQRTHEIGVRMALGAARTNVLWMVVRQGASLALLGLAIGVAGAFSLTRLLSALLFGIGATDLPTFAAALAGMMLVVLLAALVPAFRATRISPVTALRYQ